MTRIETLVSLAVNSWTNGGRVHLTDADLRGASLYATNLRDADLSGTNLRGVNFRNADLRGADLSGADLSGANLSGANLSGVILHGDTLAAYVTAADRGNYEFRLFRLEDGSHKVKAGCRWLTIPRYRAHVATYYPDTDTSRRTLAILDYFESVIQMEAPK